MAISEDVAHFLIKNGKTISIAESCTGGLMSHMMTANPGISAAFWGSVVAYSNESKRELVGVSENIIQEHGAVSIQSAEEMASAIRARCGTDIGVGITGIAGPGGATPEKPVGLVCIAVVTKENILSREHVFNGGRAGIQQQAAEAAFELVFEALHNQKI
jgi:PncC family amidohydrolase